MSLNDIENIDLTEFDDLIKPKANDESSGVKKRLSQSGAGLFHRNIKNKVSHEQDRRESSLQADSPSPSLDNLLPPTHQNEEAITSDASQSTVSLQIEQTSITNNIGSQSPTANPQPDALLNTTSELVEPITNANVSIENHYSNNDGEKLPENLHDSINNGIPNYTAPISIPLDFGMPINNRIINGIPENTLATNDSSNYSAELLSNPSYIDNTIATQNKRDKSIIYGINFDTPINIPHESFDETSTFLNLDRQDIGIPEFSRIDVGIPEKEPSSKIENSAKPKYNFLNVDELKYERPIDDNTLYHVEIKSRYLLIDRVILSTIRNIKHVTDKVIYLKLVRLSYGFGSNTTNIPIGPEALQRSTLISKVKIKLSLNNLAKQGLIERKQYLHTKGYIYKVFLDPETRQDATDKAKQIVIDQNVLDILPAVLEPGELIVFLYLYCESYGLNKNITKERIGYQTFINDLDISRNSIKKHREGLIEKRLIFPITKENNSGTYYRVMLPHEVIKCEKNIPLIKYRSSGLKIIDGKFTGMPNNMRSGDHDGINNDGLNIGIPKINAFKSIESGTPRNSPETHQSAITNHPMTNGTFTGAPNSEPYNNKNNIKTSSEQSDDVFNFFNQESKRHPGFSFAISRKKISELLEQKGPDYLKATFVKMLPSMKREGVTNPVGLYLHALEAPESYTMLQKPSAQEIADQKRYENQIELKEKSFADEFKRIIDSKQEGFWNGLDERIREEAIAKRRAEMGQGGELKIPEVAIKRSAMERTFWEQHMQSWQSLTSEERVMHAGKVKQSIIKRVYSGEDKALPNPLPERDFMRSVDDYAEKLAMITLGKVGA